MSCETDTTTLSPLGEREFAYTLYCILYTHKLNLDTGTSATVEEVIDSRM